MTSVRPTAKQAIEVLKIHQLRQENAIIFQEIKELRGSLATRQNELDQIQLDVSGLRTEVADVQPNIGEIQSQVERIKTAVASYNTEVQTLKQAHAALKDDFIKETAVSNAMQRENTNHIKDLMKQLMEVKNDIEALRKAHVEALDNIRKGGDTAAHRQALEELEDKLEDFMQDINGKLERLPNMQQPKNRLDSLGLIQSNEHQYDRPVLSLTKQADHRASSNDTPVSERWRPIDTQTALRMTPLRQPDTFVVGRPHDEEELRTPTTVRSTFVENNGISNTAHSPCCMLRPAKESFPVQERHPLAAPTVEEPEKDHGPLKQLLALRQSANEPLTRYLARFEEKTATLLTDQDSVSACLRRFVLGIFCSKEQQLVAEWLNTGDWSLQYTRDCILLLAKCQNRVQCDRLAMTRAENVSSLISGANTCQAEVIDDLTDSRPAATGVRGPEGMPLGTEKTDKQVEVQKEGKKVRHRVQPARSAKSQGREKTAVNIKGAKGVANSKTCDKPEGPRATVTEVDSATHHTEIANEADTRRKFNKRKCTRELEALSKTRLIEKSIQLPAVIFDQHGLEKQPDANNSGIGLANHQTQNSEELPQEALQRAPPLQDLRNMRNKRVPTLVKRRLKKADLVPETSDAVQLPPMPHNESTVQEDPDDQNRVRKRRRRTPPEIPILTLSTSDFRE